MYSEQQKSRYFTQQHVKLIDIFYIYFNLFLLYYKTKKKFKCYSQIKREIKTF